MIHKLYRWIVLRENLFKRMKNKIYAKLCSNVLSKFLKFDMVSVHLAVFSGYIVVTTGDVAPQLRFVIQFNQNFNNKNAPYYSGSSCKHFTAFVLAEELFAAMFCLDCASKTQFTLDEFVWKHHFRRFSVQT